MSSAESTTPPVRYREIKPGYRIGDDGSAWSCVARTWPRPGAITGLWRELKPQAGRLRGGHLHVRLGGNDIRLVHRLVLEAFVGPCPVGMECRHLDGDPTNNRLENLCWGTRRENVEDRIRHGRSGQGSLAPRSILTDADIREILLMHGGGKRHVDIARRFKVHKSTIGDILRGKSWNDVTGLPPYQPRG